MVFNSAGIWFCRYSIRFLRYLISQAFNSAGFSMLQVFKSAGIQSCRYLSLKALFLKVFNSAGIRFWRFSCLQVFNSAGIQFCRYSIPQVFDSAGIQICRFSILQVFDPAGIRAWRHQFCRYSFQRSNVCRCTFCQPFVSGYLLVSSISGVCIRYHLNVYLMNKKVIGCVPPFLRKLVAQSRPSFVDRESVRYILTFSLLLQQ